MHRREFSAGLIAGAVAFGESLQAADDAGDKPVDKDRWGDLTATFVLEGSAPEAKPVLFPGGLGVKIPADESLLVNPTGNRLVNVVAWLYLAPGVPQPPIHPDYDTAMKKPESVAITGGRLTPRITLVRPSQELVIQNLEADARALKADVFANPPLAALIPAGKEVRHVLTKQESRPCPWTSDTHPWLAGYILIRHSPYMAVSDLDGQLTMKNLPVGKHTFTFWHEAKGYVTRVKRDDKVEKWKLGRLEVDIKPGKNDLGLIICDAKHLK